VALTLGDFHSLPYADCRFDQVYCIESFCHAMDLPRALGEVARVLKPGGCFTLFDGYLTVPPQHLQPEQALAVELVARGMAIEQLQVESDLLAAAGRQGLQVQGVARLDAQVMPSLSKLERLTGAVIRFPWLGRRALARRHPARGRNVLAGYLMRNTVALGLIGYREIVLRKPPPPEVPNLAP
jgi:SAM-dependent methyltransferase